MFARMGIFATVALTAASLLAGCAGGGGAAPPPAASDAALASAARSKPAATRDIGAAQAVDVQVSAAAVTAAIPFADGVSGYLTLHASSAAGNPARLKVSAGRATAADWSAGPCPAVPPIAIANPHPYPVTVSLDRFSVHLPCSVNGQLFGASSYQSDPLPPVLVSTKLGDATGSGDTLTFVPAVSALTFPANTTLTIAIQPESSTAFTQLPAIAGVQTVLSSNAPAVPNSLALSSPSVEGGTTFQSACYVPNDPAGPGLGGLHILGIPSFYCVLVPGQANASTTFGGTHPGDAVTFSLGPKAKPDLSLVGLDGPAIYAGCTPASSGQVCQTPAFTIPVYSRVYVGNVADLRACVPAVENADCNGAGGNPKAPSATSVAHGAAFQLLFADDATYNAGNTFGGLTVHVTGSRPACSIVLSPDNNGDAPPGYMDPAAPAGSTPLLADFTGSGPYVEFDLKAKSPGTCTVDVTEDTGIKRTFALTIPVN